MRFISTLAVLLALVAAASAQPASSPTSPAEAPPPAADAAPDAGPSVPDAGPSAAPDADLPAPDVSPSAPDAGLPTTPDAGPPAESPDGDSKASVPDTAAPAAPAAPAADPSAASAATDPPATPAAPPAASPPPDPCPGYCDAMAVRCPDVFLGNRATCLAACALYPPGTADIDALRCRLPGQADATPLPQPPVAPQNAAIVTPDPATWYDHHPQLEADTSVIPPGLGAVFLPSLDLGPRAPIVTVFAGATPVADGKPGRRILLEPGRYTVRLGDGADNQQVAVTVQVEPDRTTVVPLSWGALEIEVVDPQFVPFRGAYELIRMETREVVGIGFGADELLGEQPRVWVLVPGIYKIVQPGGTYRDRSDFATVRLLPGEFSRFVLVMNPETGEFEGAGLVDEPDDTDRTWNLDGIIGGDISLLQSDIATNATDGVQLELSGFLDLSARMQAGDHRWITRLDVEESQLRDSVTGDFRNLKDRLFLHSMYSYALVPWFGPYVRVGVESALLPRHIDLVEGETLVDTDGRLLTGPARITIAETFDPTQILEGAGGNFQVWRSRAADLSVRAGVGARQQYASGLQIRTPGPDLPEDDPAAGADVLRAAPDRFIEGIEMTAIGAARVTRYVTLSTEFDALYPFDQSEGFIFTWRNQVGLRLASFASLTYRLNMTRNPQLLLVDEIQTEHTVQLRFSLTLF